MERITELFVVVEDRPGALGELLTHLTRGKINIEAIGLFQDIAKISLSDTDRAFKLLSKHKYQVERRQVLRIDLDHKPGAFAQVATKLGAAGINIDYCYATVGKGQRSASVILDVKDSERAVEVLEQ
ncbi:MAG TPA: hypothetical protein VJB38_09645 [Bacteroidota bacterium]|nr:hypothetical protein [Bacteroidota bacterium]